GGCCHYPVGASGKAGWPDLYWLLVMIFVSVGSQLPFDRLIRAVDGWACGRGLDVFAQIGQSAYLPRNIQYSVYLDSTAYREKVEKCTLFVSHAGIGSIVSALSNGKPVIVMPRSKLLGEHR